MQKLETFYHSVGFNIVKLDSILRNGLMSLDKAKKENISYARNYEGYNLNDTISLVREIYANIDTDGAYKKYISKGITISMNLPLDMIIFDISERIINHTDEVLGKDYIPKEYFTSLIIPEEYTECSIEELPILTLNSTSYRNIKDTSDNIVKYVENVLHKEIDKEEYYALINELKYTMIALKEDINDEGLNADFMEIKRELNCFLTSQINIAFSKYINKENITIYDIVEYINHNTLNLPIIIKNYKRGKTR
jgi:hypothetical protein